MIKDYGLEHIKSSDFYRHMFESVHDPILIIRPDGQIIEANKAIIEASGYSKDELLCMNIADLRPPSEKPRVLEHIEKYHEGRVFETLYMRKDGSVFPVEISPGEATLGDDKTFVGVIRDITERKQTEEALHKKEEMLRHIIDSSPIPMVLYNESTNDYYYNKKFTETFGYTVEDVPSINEWWLLAYPDEEYREFVRKRWYAAVDEAIKNRTSIAPQEVEITCKDGSKRYVLSEFSSIGDINLSVLYDITERKRAEEALQISEEKFRVLTETASAAICILQDGMFRHVNNATERITGYSKNVLLSMNFLNLIHPEFKSYVVGLYTDWLQGKIKWARFETKIIRKDGAVRWIDVSVSTLEYRERPGLILTATDVTKRKRTEEALRESETNLARAQAIAHLGYWEVDIRTNRVSGSDELYRVFNLKPDVTLDAYVEKMHPDDRERVARSINATIYEGTPYNIDYRIVPRPGDIRHVHAEGEVIHDEQGHPLKFFGTVLDVTERKQAEEVLKVSEAKFRALFEYAGAAIFIADRATGEIIDCNRKAENLLGRPREEIIGLHQTQLHPAHKAEEYRQMFARHAHENPAANFEAEVQHRDGRVIPVMINARPMEINGRAIMIGFFPDITELKQAEEESKATKAQAELYLDLMGHDINNMNQSAMGFLELALQTLETDGKIGLDGKLFIEKPLQAIRSSSMLIGNVRKLQRLMTEGVKTRPVDLHDLFEDLRTHDFHARDRDITVNFEEVPHYTVEASELLGDVFYNLISNSVKHSRPDVPVTVDVKVERVDEEGRAYCRCTVEDNGPGIPDELKPRLFNRFQRGKTQAHGKGLGLYLVRTLVEGYHGKVWVEDRVPGDHTKGAKFMITLPLAEN